MVIRSIFQTFLLVRPQICSSIRNFSTPLLFRSKTQKNISICSVKFSTTTFYNRRVNDDHFKTQLLKTMNFKCEEDAQPFYKLPVRTLIHIQKTTVNDYNNGFCANRLYYLSSRIQYPSVLLSKKLAARHFVYSLSFEWLQKSLDVLLNMGVTGDRIVRDLWVLKYHHATINERLQKIKDVGIDNLYPWMVRCSPNILNRYINITQETKSILGDDKSTQMYLAERLNISLDAVEEMCTKIPTLKTIRVTKVKKFLDYLIEEGYSVEDIANRPRILASSQSTIQQRLEQLRLLGLQHINLNILCRSKKGYDKFYETFCSCLKNDETL